MGFNKRFVTFDRCIEALNKGELKKYYGKSDVLSFKDDISPYIYNLHSQGKSDEEILIIINQKTNMEENNEVC